MAPTPAHPPGTLLTTAQVAARFRVDPKTVTRWANQGLLRTVRTPAGYRRFLAEDAQQHLTVTR